MSELKSSIKELTSGEKAWPRSKLMVLRDVLRKDEAERMYFLQEMKSRKRSLPVYSGANYHEQLWYKTEEDKQAKTPYFDIIELMDFYPNELL